MTRRLLWWSAWIAVAGLFAWAFVPAQADAARRAAGSPVERLLGPVASLAASVQWVRFDAALRRGDTARAYARAEGALRLDPGEPSGWIFLARHLVYERGSLLREPDRDARARWVEAGLDTLRRGEPQARDPGALLFERGVVLAFQASLPDEDRAFPRGETEAWELASEAFAAAAAAGSPDAARAAELARQRAAGAGR
ncbi:MAG: hypothetical protein ACKVXR_09645 [Planctomycetota bacterium]